MTSIATRLLAGAVFVSLTVAGGALAQGDPPSRRSKAFDGQPTLYGTRGAPEGELQPSSPYPWPGAGAWRIRPLTRSPELDPGEPPLPAPPNPPAEAHEAAPLPRPPLVDIPLPPRRPPALGGLAPLTSDPKEFAAGGACFAQLQAAGTVFAPAQQPGGSPGCGIDNPVQVSAMAERGAPGGRILLPDRPIVSCRMAVRFGEWLRAVAPGLGASRNSPLTSIVTGPGWECRGRNRQRGARLSSHANGDALDVNSFVFANRTRLAVAGSGRMSACSYFTTVLGPGSAFHDSHLHVDIMRHGRDGTYRLCR